MKKVLSFLLVLLMVLASPVHAEVSKAEVLPFARKEASGNLNYTFRTIDGGIVTTEADSSKNATVLMFGMTTCVPTMRNIAKSDWIHNSGIKVIYVEIMKASLEQTMSFAEQYGCGEITFCYDEGDDAFAAAMAYAKLAGLNGTIPLPILILLDSSNQIQDTLAGYQTSDSILSAINQFTKIEVQDSEPEVTELVTGPSYNIMVSGSEDYDAANSILGLVNEARTAVGAPALQMDAELCNTAMIRAAELALFYSHTRPNGEKCYSIFRTNSSMRAENIAVGQDSAEAVMNSWMNSSGHYANIISSDMKSIGIGCFMDKSGMRYWVQCFDNAKSTTPQNVVIKLVTRTIPVLQSLLSLSTSASHEIGCGSTQTEMEMKVYNINSEWSYSKVELAADNFIYGSNNPSVAEVDQNGIIRLKASGTAVITASLKQNQQMQVCTNVTKKAHQYNVTVIEPTTVQGGYDRHTCISCGDTYDDNYTPALQMPSDDAEQADGVPEDSSEEQSQDTEQDMQTGNESEGNEPIELTDENVQLLQSSVVCNGKAQQPEVAVTDESGNILSSEYYEVRYYRNREVGYGLVTIDFRGPYIGSVTKQFTILPKGTSIAKATAAKRSFTVKWKKQSTQTDGYEIQYSTSSKFTKTTTVTIRVKKNSTISKKITGLRGNKKYYVRVRTYKKDSAVSNRVFYSAWSKAVSVKTEK